MNLTFSLVREVRMVFLEKWLLVIYHKNLSNTGYKQLRMVMISNRDNHNNSLYKTVYAHDIKQMKWILRSSNESSPLLLETLKTTHIA